METIKNINDFIKFMGRDNIDSLRNYFDEYTTYPVTFTYDDEKIVLATDADRVPFTNSLRFPFTEENYENAMSGLQCVTDYAMNEGYDNTHKDLFNSLALRYAESHGICEYKVNKEFMEYWSLYEDGFYFIRIDLNTNDREEVCRLPWDKNDGYPIPSFLMTPEGFTKYNYFEG